MSAAFFYTSGQTLHPDGPPVDGPGDRAPDLFFEPRGSQRYDAQPRLDFKLEKQFRFGTDRRFGVTFEGFNIGQRRRSYEPDHALRGHVLRAARPGATAALPPRRRLPLLTIPGLGIRSSGLGSISQTCSIGPPARHGAPFLYAFSSELPSTRFPELPVMNARIPRA